MLTPGKVSCVGDGASATRENDAYNDCEDKAKDVQSTDYLQEPSLAAKLTQSPNPIQMI